MASEAVECSICLAVIGPYEQEKIACGHCFHRSCIGEWLLKSSTCPYCRVDVPLDTTPFYRANLVHITWDARVKEAQCQEFSAAIRQAAVPLRETTLRSTLERIFPNHTFRIFSENLTHGFDNTAYDIGFMILRCVPYTRECETYEFVYRAYGISVRPTFVAPPAPAQALA
jgi:hypothetical protein